MIKVNRLDAHDRLKDFKKKSNDIGECCQDLLNQRPFGNIPFYIFVHPRSGEISNVKRLIWQPRLTRPKAQTNSMLFKAYPGKDLVKIIWMIPPREMFDSFQKGKMTESKTICESIHAFEYNRAMLDTPEDDDLTDDQIDAIYKDMATDAKRNKLMNNLWLPH